MTNFPHAKALVISPGRELATQLKNEANRIFCGKEVDKWDRSWPHMWA